MASTGRGGAARGRERSTSNAQTPAGKRRKADSGPIGDATEEGNAAKNNLDIIIENWATVHACLGQKDVVHSSRTCRQLHDLCVDENGKVRVNEIYWSVMERNFARCYRMLQNVRFDKIKYICLGLVRSLPVHQMATIFTILSSHGDTFPLLEEIDISCSFPDGLELLLADFGSKLANYSPDLRELRMQTEAFSQGSFAFAKPLLQKNVLMDVTLHHSHSHLRGSLIGNHQAEELAEMITSSTNLEHLQIELFGSGSELVSSWFKTKLLSAIRAKSLGSENILASQSRLQCLRLYLGCTGDSGLNAEELVHLLRHFSGLHLSELGLYGNLISTGSTSSLNSNPGSADEICHLLSLSPSLTEIAFNGMRDDNGFLWSVLSRFVSEKESSCEVTYLPRDMNPEFFEGLKRGARSIVPFIKRRGGGSKWDAMLSDTPYGWTLRVKETSTDENTV